MGEVPDGRSLPVSSFQGYAGAPPPPRPPSRFKISYLLAIVAVLAVVASGLWMVRGRLLGNHLPPPPPAAELSSGSSDIALNPGPPTASAPTSSAPSPSTPASASATPAATPSPQASSPAASASAPPTSRRPTHAAPGPCAGEGKWAATPKAQYLGTYLPMKVVMGTIPAARCDRLYVFSIGNVPKPYRNARVGFQIQYVPKVLTYNPGHPGRAVKVDGRYILRLRVNAPASGYEAGAKKEARFAPGSHMVGAKALGSMFKRVRDLVFLGSDKRVSYYAFGLDKPEPFKIWVHLNSRRQVEWALMIAHK